MSQLLPLSFFFIFFPLLNPNPVKIHLGTNISIITSGLTKAPVIRSFYLEKKHMVLLFDRPWGTRIRLTVCCHLSAAQNGMQQAAPMESLNKFVRTHLALYGKILLVFSNTALNSVNSGADQTMNFSWTMVNMSSVRVMISISSPILITNKSL